MNKLAEEFKKSDLEILVSTMNRNNLDFLIAMFPFADFTDFNILIVNQTENDKILNSGFSNIKVINSYEKGLSKSRNLALKNASKKIGLIGHDDVVFIEGFDAKIIDSYNQNPLASLITFQTKTFENRPFRKYKKNNFWLKEKDLVWILSIEITFKIEELKKKDIHFNELFGLGAKFQDAESLYFLRRANYQKQKILFEPKDIVIHEETSSSDEITSDRWLYAKTAGFYKRYQSFSYILVFKMVFYLLRKKLISYKQITHKLNIGMSGINDYKKLIKNNSEHFYD